MSDANADYREYVDRKKEIHTLLLSFLENNQENDFNFNYLIQNIRSEKLESNREELEHFLRLIINISNNHCRKGNLIQKVEKIILNLKDEITQTFSNSEIFNIFNSNKLILLFLLDNKILKFDDNICTEVMYKIDLNEKEYCLFFYPEIKSSVSEDKIERITKELFEIDKDILNNFDENRHKGENDSYICSLIRQDSVEEFISYVNKTVYSLSSKIKPSLFETNPFLIQKTITLIEYAAFFGSIQIFQYLKLNKVELTPSLWLYAIHSNNPELIHLLEENQIEPPDNSYNNCIIESIKCHHNDIENYIENNKDLEPISDFNNDVNSFIYDCHNYSLFPYELDKNHAFFYLCYNKFYTLIDLYIKMKENEIKNIIGILKKKKN